MLKIIVETSIRTQIDNVQNSFGVDEYAKHLISQHKKKYKEVKFKSEFSSHYNCHGCTFANRRTNIHDSQDVTTILFDDQYELVEMKDVLAGDIVIYVDPAGVLEHSGTVIDPGSGIIRNPLILSKWGQLGEVIHRVADCPYDSSNIEYYRCL